MKASVQETMKTAERTEASGELAPGSGGWGGHTEQQDTPRGRLSDSCEEGNHDPIKKIAGYLLILLFISCVICGE